MSSATNTKTNARLAIPRKLLDDYLREASGRLASRKAEIGGRIREARKAKPGMLQKHLAQRVHVESQTVSNWERGFSTPDYDMLERVAVELGRPVEWFLSEPTQPAPQPDAGGELPDKLDQMLALLEEVRASQAALQERVDELASQQVRRERG